MFYDIKDLDMAIYADDDTPYTFSTEPDVLLIRLKNRVVKIFEWFHKSHFKPNVNKCNII